MADEAKNDPLDDGDPLAPDASSVVPKFELTQAHKDSMLKAWNDGARDMATVIKAAFGDGVDGRSIQGRAAKKWLAEQNIRAWPAHKPPNRQAGIALTDEAKQLIEAYDEKNMSILEMARLVFKNASLTPLSAEFKVVNEYYKQTHPPTDGSDSDLVADDYRPPVTRDQALVRINKYAHEQIDVDHMTPHQKEWVRRLICYMQTHRFIFEMNNLRKKSERTLMESSFVKYTYNKPDLTEEDVDLYINLCYDIVNCYRMKCEEAEFVRCQTEAMAIDGKIPMAIVEAIGKLRSDIDSSVIRQKKLVDDLTSKRSKRIESAGSDKNSMLNLIEAFKESKKRKQILGLIEARRNKVKTEADNLKNMDELRVEILGLKEDELFI